MGDCLVEEQKNIDMETKEELEFFDSWFELEAYSFKIISVITILADEQRAYRGTLNDFCEFLDIQKSSGNKGKIKATLEGLVKNQYIRVIIDKDIYTISLAAAAEKEPKIIKIKKAWYNLIKENSDGTSWNNVLKVFIKLYDLDNQTIVTQTELSSQLNMSVKTIARCIKIITSINFSGFGIKATVINKKDEEKGFYCLGTMVEKILIFK